MNFGTVTYSDGCWRIDCEPHVRAKLKRVFPEVDRRVTEQIVLSDNDENCRDLLWFLDRYPMTIDNRQRLQQGAADHVDQQNQIEELLEHRRPPDDFTLALPPRAYQATAASLARIKQGLLIADDVGLGKTVTGICPMAHSDHLPALVVTLTHLPSQWAAELKRFAPELDIHVLKSGRPYDLVPKRSRKQASLFDEPRLPDVIITNYHKLNGWAEVLGGLVRYVVFDEVQELRRDESAKYAAARYIAKRAQLRIGLSATPIYNYGSEFFNVIDLLLPGALGTADEFLREWCGQDYQKIKDPKAFGEHLRREGIMIRRTRADVGRELPPVTKIPQVVEADQHALERIKGSAVELAKIILAAQQNHRGEKFMASEEFNVLMRQATGIAKAPYVAEFVRLLLQSEQRVVLYGWHRECFAKGTGILMYDGSVKPVEEVLVGDMVMGPDSSPRRVLNLTRGNGQLLRVVPKKGQPWVCSANHILALRCGAKNRRPMVTMTARSFQTLSTRSQRDYTLYRADTTTFEACEQVTEPWLLGYWLGDGVSNIEQGVRISTGDSEVVAEAQLIAERHGLSLTKHVCKDGTTDCAFYHFSSGGSSGGWNRNPLLKAFKSLGLQRNKHVPLIYKTASVLARRELLAGLLDSDGHVYQGNGSGTAEFTNKDQRLANDVAFIARSLGLAAYVSESVRQTCWTKQPTRYFRVTISGDLTTIPTRILRKNAPPRNSPKNVLHTGFTVEEAGYGDYFGFEVDGDHLFLLDDFTVVHNCYSIWLEQLAEFKPRLYTGSESTKQKDEAKAAFTDGDCRLLIISLRAGAGLDGLQNVCGTVVFGELDWSPGVHEQCVGRVYRDGQAEPVMAYYLIAEDGADPIISDVLGVKRGQIEGVRDPNAELIERLEGDVGNMKRLAEEYLRRNGVAIERGPIPEIVS